MKFQQLSQFPIYEISRSGVIRRISNNRIKKPYADSFGLMCVSLQYAYGISLETKVHNLVWTTFKGPIPKGMVVHHKNDDKTDNRLANLEPGAKRVPQSHHFHPHKKLDFNKIFRLHKKGLPLKDIAAEVGITRNYLKVILYGPTFQGHRDDFAANPRKKIRRWVTNKVGSGAALSTEDRRKLISLRNRGVAIKDLMKKFDRSEGSIRRYIEKGWHEETTTATRP